MPELDDFFGSFAEVTEIDPDAMTTDAPAPPPEFDEKHPRGIPYQIRAKLAAGAGKEKAVYTALFPEKCVTLTNKTSKPQIIVDFEIVSNNPRYNGQTKREWIGTSLMGGNTTPIDTLLRALTGSAAPMLSAAQKIKKVYDLLVTLPLLSATTQWVLELTDKNDDGTYPKPVLVGMKNFPCVNVSGVDVYRPLEEALIKQPDNTMLSFPARTRWRIKKYLPRTGGESVVEDEGVPF
jgi:hypothetical protein